MKPVASSTTAEQTSKTVLSVELANRCNLHCSYCLRDEDALYRDRAEFFPAELLEKIVVDARAVLNFSLITFTGGEVTMHPRFAEIVRMIARQGLQLGFVTNGWLFDRVYPVLAENLSTVRVIAFSLDGTSAEAHDRWRGEGSFIRVIRAITLCRAAKIPFVIKVGVRRDTAPLLQDFALFSARLGATRLEFSHLLPNSPSIDREFTLTQDERRNAEHEIAILSNIFKMKVTFATGYFNIDPVVPCVALSGQHPNIDYRGRLTLCCNLSGYRGAAGEEDVVADLKTESFAQGYERLLAVATSQVARRKEALETLAASGVKADVGISSPCMFCLQSFRKIPQQGGPGNRNRKLAVLSSLPPHIGS
jgi:MoaA/NifB/PqqE/SkfB family radical SAM enzyme